MRIIESSVPGLVEKDRAMWLLAERAVLTSSVCNEEEARTGLYDRRPLAALRLLDQWIFDNYGKTDGLHKMAVPDGAEHLMQEILIGEKVCAALRMSRTADHLYEFVSDMEKVKLTLREWRGARAKGFAAEGAEVKVQDDPWPFVLYMTGHPALGLRKVGLTKAGRLELWRQRGWVTVDLKRFESGAELKVAEDLAKYRLDQLGARGTPLMESLFSNLAADGRTEMYDAGAFLGDLGELLGDGLGAQLGELPRLEPLWITEPRTAAAFKATANRDNFAAAAKAVDTRATNKPQPGPQEAQ